MDQTETMRHSRLNRQLGLFDSVMVMVGIVIGSGIFLTTGLIAKSLPSPGLILLVWVVGGILTLAGALTYAELGASLPHAGGQYVYLREAYGPLCAFLFGWVVFLVYMSGGTAALSVAFAEYFGYFFPTLSIQEILFTIKLSIFGKSLTYSLSAGQIVAVTAIIILSLFNYIGLSYGKIIQNVFTLIKIGAIMCFVVLGFAVGKGQAFDLMLSPAGIDPGQLIIGFGIALVAVSWAFDGWNNVNFVAGEIKNPKKNIPLALIFGTIGITILYVLVNYIYLYSLPVDRIVGEIRVAEKAASSLFGREMGSIIAAVVMVSTFGALNGNILTAPRVYFAMARDRLFFKRVGDVHPRFKTPGFAIIVGAVWASILTLSGTFEQLLTFVMFVAIIFWIAAALSVFTLRRKFPRLQRPYKTWGYPYVPILFIITSLGILINTVIEKPVESLSGILITLLGIPVYYYWKKTQKTSESETR